MSLIPYFCGITPRMFKWPLLCLLLICTPALYSQEFSRILVRQFATDLPISGATISASSKSFVTNDSGLVLLVGLPAGQQRLIITHVGYRTLALSMDLPLMNMRIVELEPIEDSLQSVTIVSSTRTNQRIENSPLKVEVLGREEMDEENTIKPGNIASILGDVSGIQVQQSSAVSGNANVRIQGLDGRYTQLLRDGMPLFDGFSGGFGILTIPPLDLKQIELIKGSASTLYGGGAIGGLINLISRRPTFQPEGSITINRSTLKESNVNTYLSARNQHAGFTFFGGLTRQAAVDVNDDGFSDVAKDLTFMIHPRIFFYPGNHSTITVGYSGTFDKRIGGDMQVLSSKPDASHRYFEENISRRNTYEFFYNQLLGTRVTMEVKGSLSNFNRSINTNTHRFDGRQNNYFSEASIVVPSDKQTLVVGLNAVGDRFRVDGGDPVLLSNVDNQTLGVFAQYTKSWHSNTTLELGLRGDHHNRYGAFLLPRLAFFHRFDEHWAARAGAGYGYKAPNALSPQNTEPAIETISSLPAGIKAERSMGYNIEFNYRKDFGEDKTLFINHAFFLTTITDPVIASQSPTGITTFSNANGTLGSKGFDTYVQLKIDSWELYAGYTFTIARRYYLEGNPFIELTPKNRFAFVLVNEFSEHWRIGVEGSYTGPQYRDNDSHTPGFLFMAAVVERKFSNMASLVLNCENLLDYRQSRHEALYTGSIDNPNFKSLWAPIDGRVVNLSLRWNFLRAK